MLPTHNNTYSNKEYWETRFESEDEFDWLGCYSRYGEILESMIDFEDSILVLGCGNSSLSSHLYDSGRKRITNIDYAQNVVDSMREKHKQRAEMSWTTMDILEMEFAAESFDVVVDKATLDTFMVAEKDPWHTSPETQVTMDTILQQVSNLLKPNGRFISITWAQPHFRKRLLAKQQYDWSIETRTFGTGFEYFIYMMTKGQLLSEADLNITSAALTQTVHEETESSTHALPTDSEDFLNNILIND